MSCKKVTKTGQKTHRERQQPESRKSLGLLEKKKDYVLRAKDYSKKQAVLKLLRKRVLNKNNDEFHFHMINSKIEDSVHWENAKDKEYTADQLTLMRTQDLKYLSYKRNVEAKKIEKLQNQLHMIDTVNDTTNRHTFFVDNKKEVREFDVSKRFNTHLALMGRRSNRPRLNDLKARTLLDIDQHAIAKIEQQKHMAYTELQKRVDRERGLTIIQEKLEIERALKVKAPKKLKKLRSGSKDAPPIYQWNFERKR